jgi:hypothetical protein
MEYTGVFATAEELDELTKLAITASTTPVMAMSLGDGLAGRDFMRMAQKRAEEACQKAAEAHGLLKCRQYGITKEGEFFAV